MKLKRTARKGTLLVMAIGMMSLVSFLLVNQLDSIKMSFNVRRSMDYQRMSDIAARSGLDYGYSMIKNVMESMSMVDLRFATHFHSDHPGKVPEVPPAWQEIINNRYDFQAKNAWNTVTEGHWIGTDSYDLGTHFENHGTTPKTPLDFEFAAMYHDTVADGLGSTVLGSLGSDSLMRIGPIDIDPGDPGPDGLGPDFKNIGFRGGEGSHDTIKECAVERFAGTTYTLQDNGYRSDACQEEKGVGPTALNVAQNTPGSYSASEYNNMRDGHFGTKRWHYYNQWDFSAGGGENVVSDEDGRGTGGMIRKDPEDLDQGAGYFSNHANILFERLFNYKRDEANLKFPYEPINVSGTTPEERDLSEWSYQVEMYTHLNLDGVDFQTEADLMNPNDYSLVKYKLFFKLWVTRDEDRSRYGTRPSTVVVEAFFKDPSNTAIDLKDWQGANLSTLTASGEPLDIDTSTFGMDLHPLWMIPRLNASYVVWDQVSASAGTTQVALTSLRKPDYKTDFLDWDGDGDITNRLGALGFPVPYLAYQRGDYDYFPAADRGDQSKILPIDVDHDHYTRFTLWSMGTVREVDPDLFTGSGSAIYPDDEQRIDHFKIVARTLYRMDFFMDTRAVDVNDEEGYYYDDGSAEEVVGGCDGNKRNLNNIAYFASRRIPACDLDSTAEAVKQVFEPMGIYIDNFQKVNYNSSVK